MHKQKSLLKLSGLLDSQWYLEQYPDVTQAGMEPAEHFLSHGFEEGRFLSSEDFMIWFASTLDAQLLQKLEIHIKINKAPLNHYAAWLLGRWYAMRDDWQSVFRCLLPVFKWSSEKKSRPFFLLWCDALRMNGYEDEAKKQLKHAMLQVDANDVKANTDLHFALANVLHAQAQLQHDCKEWLSCINEIYKKADLLPLKLHSDFLHFDAIECETTTQDALSLAVDMPLVSVVLPIFNAAQTIKTALVGLTCQTWSNLEIIVVDDASTDETVEIVLALAKKDSRIRLIKMTQNGGAYVARNEGVSQAKGEFITIHDGDDWSHSQKIQLQVLPLLENNKLMGTLSHWIRASNDLQFGSWKSPASWTGWVHHNTSSLLIRRKVIDEIGYWDRVSCSADTEYYHRLVLFYGMDSLVEVLPGIALSFGRFHTASLTQVEGTSIFSIFSGLRREYADAYMAWHASVENKCNLYMPKNPTKRMFKVPEQMLPDKK